VAERAFLAGGAYPASGTAAAPVLLEDDVSSEQVR
jgi:hypothetical protein